MVFLTMCWPWCLLVHLLWASELGASSKRNLRPGNGENDIILPQLHNHAHIVLPQ